MYSNWFITTIWLLFAVVTCLGLTHTQAHVKQKAEQSSVSSLKNKLDASEYWFHLLWKMNKSFKVLKGQFCDSNQTEWMEKESWPVRQDDIYFLKFQ